MAKNVIMFLGDGEAWGPKGGPGWGPWELGGDEGAVLKRLGARLWCLGIWGEKGEGGHLVMPQHQTRGLWVPERVD